MTKRSNVRSILYMFVTVIGLATFVVTMNASYLLLAQPSEAVAAQTGPFNPGARLDTAQIDDLRTLPTDPADDTDAQAEGRDVLITDYGTVPEELWAALLDMGFRGIPNDGPHGTDREALYVPVGTVVPVPGGLCLATLDGWMTCRDTAQVQECSATGPVVPVDA